MMVVKTQHLYIFLFLFVFTFLVDGIKTINKSDNVNFNQMKVKVSSKTRMAAMTKFLNYYEEYSKIKFSKEQLNNVSIFYNLD